MIYFNDIFVYLFLPFWYFSFGGSTHCWLVNLWTITQCRGLSKDAWHQSFCSQPKFCPAHLLITITWRKKPLREEKPKTRRHINMRNHSFCLAILGESFMTIFFKIIFFTDLKFNKNRRKNHYGIKWINLAFCRPILKRQSRIG
jgi:hypothetical protein